MLVDTKVFAKRLRWQPAEVTELVKKSNLRGRGGAGFPTGMKWSFVPMGKEAPHPKYLVANADEMEPGTFKDRALMERDPHQLIEGMIVAAYAIEADIGYIFLRGEYECSNDRLSRAIAEASSSATISAITFSARATALTSISTPAPAATSAAKRPRC